MTALRLKHPPSPLDLRPPPTEPVTQTSSVSEEEAMVDQKSFCPSSAGGVDGLRPGHLKDLVAPQTAEAGRSLLKPLSIFVQNSYEVKYLNMPATFFLAAYLTALRKKDGGIRPISVGNVFHRLASKIAAKRVNQNYGGSYLRFNSVLASVVERDCSTSCPRFRPNPGCA